MRKRTRALLGSLTAAAMVALTPLGAVADTYWQCVPFARLISGIQIFGDARTWWQQASGRYETGSTPQAGAVLCFKPTQRMQLGHVAVVSQVVTERVVQITHANWSPFGGSRGQVEKDVTVIDVSQTGDWSTVKVWYDPNLDLGASTYPVHGFIYPDAQAKVMATTGLSKLQNGAIAIAQSAASQMGAALRPGAGAMNMLSQAADSTDRIGALIANVLGGGQSKDSANDR
jgi:surface antigen